MELGLQALRQGLLWPAWMDLRQQQQQERALAVSMLIRGHYARKKENFAIPLTPCIL
jgi:hypothetical protein